MNLFTKKVGRYVALAIAIFGFSASASAASLKAPPQTVGNKGFLFFPVGANFQLTARTQVNTADRFNANALGTGGTVWIDALGAGVQSAIGMGSKSMQGSPPDGDEELIATFNSPVDLTSIKIDLNNVNLSKGLDFGDDPFLYIQHASNPSLWDVFNETTWGAAFSMIGPTTGQLNLALLGLSNFDVSAIKIRETHELLYMSAVDGSAAVAVPEPATMLLMLSGLTLVAFVRRKHLPARV
ncbi:MAG: PEP-CTERM sorting domain-containing protein [Chlamydiales bacterium]|nr:PEP-CTERM sorting domain-containing protein [Chlamydiales bacterium]